MEMGVRGSLVVEHSKYSTIKTPIVVVDTKMEEICKETTKYIDQSDTPPDLKNELYLILNVAIK